ncbi:MAG: mechanosensitive ion channel [Myxococcales bacterium]|nr:mechanosensitive ion channel [Myxococcales bacterium]
MDFLSKLYSYVVINLGGHEVTLGTISGAALLAIFVWLTMRLSSRIIRRALHAKGVTDDGTIMVSSRLTNYVILLIGIALMFQYLGIDLGTLFAAGAIFAVGIGFALQSVLQNFVSGIILLVERSIKPGDVIEVEGMLARVKRLGIRSTIVFTRDGHDIVVPNGVLSQSSVKNFTLDDRLRRIVTKVGVVYGSDMRLVRECLERAAAEVNEASEREPQVFMVEFGNHSVDFEVAVWTPHAWLERQLRSKLNERIWWILKDNGIVIAFPQLDLHLDPDINAALQRIARMGQEPTEPTTPKDPSDS